MQWTAIAVLVQIVIFLIGFAVMVGQFRGAQNAFMTHQEHETKCTEVTNRYHQRVDKFNKSQTDISGDLKEIKGYLKGLAGEGLNGG